MTTKLTDDQIRTKLADLPNWSLGDDGKLHRDYKRADALLLNERFAAAVGA